MLRKGPPHIFLAHLLADEAGDDGAGNIRGDIADACQRLPLGLGDAPLCIGEFGGNSASAFARSSSISANGSPIAREALDRIGTLFDIERTVAGKSPDQRRTVRQSLSKEKLDRLAEWLDQQLKSAASPLGRLRASVGKSELAGAIRSTPIAL